MPKKSGLHPTKQTQARMTRFTSNNTLKMVNDGVNRGGKAAAEAIRKQIEVTIKTSNRIQPRLAKTTKDRKKARGASRPSQPLFESGDLAESYVVLGPKKTKGGNVYELTLPKRSHDPRTRSRSDITLRKLAEIHIEGHGRVPARPYLGIVASQVFRRRKEFGPMIAKRIEEAFRAAVEKGV